MLDSSRRGFLVATGAGVAAAAVTPTLLSPASANAAGGPTEVVAYVKDAKAGTLAIMVGEREVTVTDKDLAARIQKYARA